jgi:hypothetical protein
MGQLDEHHVVLSYGQRRLWALDRLQGASATYNIPIALRLSGQLNAQALAQSIVALVARHQPLRTVITEGTEGEPLGVLLALPEAHEALVRRDLSAQYCALKPTQQQALVKQQVEYEGATAFNLATERPLRATLLKLDEREHLLMLTVHHHAGDGVSMGIIARELNQAYQAYCNGQAPAWTPLGVQYADWAIWQQAYLEQGLEDKVERARARLANAPETLTLPLDYARHPDRARSAALLSLTISAAQTQGLEALARQQHTTLLWLHMVEVFIS